MEEAESNSHRDDPFYAILPTATISWPEEPVQVQSFPSHQDENEARSKFAANEKPGKIAAYWQQECRPWLKQNPSSCQANPGYEAAKRQPKLEPTGMLRKMNKEEETASAIYKKVMERVANETHGAFLKHYDDDSVHAKLQELWKLKLMNFEVGLVPVAAKFPTGGVATSSNDLNPPYKRRKICSGGTLTVQEKGPPPAPSHATTSIPLRREPSHFQCFPACPACNGTNSKSAAYRKPGKIASYVRQPSRPWLANAGFEEGQSKPMLQ